MGKTSQKLTGRRRRRMRIRKKIAGSAQRPRLSVFRSNRHIVAQLIDDQTGTTIVAASSFSSEIKQNPDAEGGKVVMASRVGKILAQKALNKGIESVVFDRGGYKYHGRVKALADGAREGGLKF